MAQPLYDGKNIFDSQQGAGDSLVWISNGILEVPNYEKIIQTLHFNGENGNRYLDMGYGDQKWTYRGLIFAPTLDTLDTNLNVIQSYADNDPGNPASYKPLRDTIGNYYTSALLLKMNKLWTRKFLIGYYEGSPQWGYISDVMVEGVVQGFVQDTPASGF